MSLGRLVMLLDPKKMRRPTYYLPIKVVWTRRTVLASIASIHDFIGWFQIAFTTLSEQTEFTAGIINKRHFVSQRQIYTQRQN